MLLEGKKTYIIGIALIVYAIGGLVAGKIAANIAIAEIMAGLGMMGLRAGISKV